ncbi:MAG: alpha/beta hydrolase [Puniceicoccaceae bacterium]
MTRVPRMIISRVSMLLLTVSCLTCIAQAQQPNRIEPTHANVAYGEHPQQIIDFYLVDGKKDRPLAIYIHGGGFRGGSHDRVNAKLVQDLNAAGIHFASVEYRLIGDAPLPAAHDDVIRAMQFIRFNAGKWNIDKERIGATGGSAGAQLVAFLAWHDDYADPESEDPIEQESSRLTCVAPTGCQSTMDIDWWLENIPGYTQPHREKDEYTQLSGVALEAVTREISVINHISPGDPPVYLQYNMAPGSPIPEENAQGWKVHHVNFGLAMEEKLKEAGVEVTLNYRGAEGVKYSSVGEFLIDKLK